MWRVVLEKVSRACEMHVSGLDKYECVSWKVYVSLSKINGGNPIGVIAFSGGIKGKANTHVSFP